MPQFYFSTQKIQINQSCFREWELTITVSYHLQIKSHRSWNLHNVTLPYTTVMFESAGSFLAFQAQLNSSWIVLFLRIKYNGKLIWLLKQTLQHPRLLACLCINIKNKTFCLLHLHSKVKGNEWGSIAELIVQAV